MKAIVLVIVVILAGVMQVSFLAALRPWGVVPNLLLVVALMGAAYLEASTAVAVALGGGLLADLASGSDFGLRMGTYGLIVLVAVASRRAGLKLHQFGTLAAAVLLGSLGFDGVVIANLILVNGWKNLSLPVILTHLVIGVALNILLLILILPLAQRVFSEGDDLRVGVRL